MLIGLTGNKGVGKDTAAQFLVDELGYIRVGFADSLKQSVARLFNIDFDDVNKLKDHMGWIEIRHPLSSEPLTMTWRVFLQRYGTEAHRDVFGDNFWVAQVEQKINDLHGAGIDNIVITDCRFNNEAVAIHYWGGSIVRIVRPGHEPDGHASEEPIHDDLVESEIYNGWSMESFKEATLDVVTGLEMGVGNNAV